MLDTREYKRACPKELSESQGVFGFWTSVDEPARSHETNATPQTPVFKSVAMPPLPLVRE